MDSDKLVVLVQGFSDCANGLTLLLFSLHTLCALPKSALGDWGPPITNLRDMQGCKERGEGGDVLLHTQNSLTLIELLHWTPPFIF